MDAITREGSRQTLIKPLKPMARRHQQTRVEHEGQTYRITVDSDYTSVHIVEWTEQDGRPIQLIGDVSKEERANVLLDNPNLSSAESYRRALDRAWRQKNRPVYL